MDVLYAFSRFTLCLLSKYCVPSLDLLFVYCRCTFSRCTLCLLWMYFMFSLDILYGFNPTTSLDIQTETRKRKMSKETFFLAPLNFVNWNRFSALFPFPWFSHSWHFLFNKFPFSLGTEFLPQTIIFIPDIFTTWWCKPSIF